MVIILLLQITQYDYGNDSLRENIGISLPSKYSMTFSPEK